MRYVDGFVLPVPKKNLKLYRDIAKKAGKVWREHGALQYVEAVGDDLDMKFGVSFKQTIKLKPGKPCYSRSSFTSRERIAIVSTQR